MPSFYVKVREFFICNRIVEYDVFSKNDDTEIFEQPAQEWIDHGVSIGNVIHHEFGNYNYSLSMQPELIEVISVMEPTLDQREEKFIEDFFSLLDQYGMKLKHDHYAGIVIQRPDQKYIAQGKLEKSNFLRYVWDIWQRRKTPKT